MTPLVVKIIKYLLIFIIILILLIHIYFSVNPDIINLDKSEILDFFKEYSPHYIVVNKRNHHEELFDTLKYPLIFKPDFCQNYAHGVSLVKNKKQAKEYFEKSLDDKIIIQEFHKGPYEGTIHYIRHPLSKKVKIVVVERLPNKNSKKDWIWKSAVLAKKYGFSIKYRPDLETEDLKNKIHDISTKVPNLFYGRYDIRFTDYKKLKKGEGFKILELNEDGSDTRYSETHSFFYNFKILINHFFTRIEFGILNIILLRSVNIIDTIKRLYENILRISECNHFSHYIHAFDKFKSIFVDSP